LPTRHFPTTEIKVLGENEDILRTVRKRGKSRNVKWSKSVRRGDFSRGYRARADPTITRYRCRNSLVRVVLAERTNATLIARSAGRSLDKEKREASVIAVSYNITVSVSRLRWPSSSLISSRDRGNEAPRAVAADPK